MKTRLNVCTAGWKHSDCILMATLVTVLSEWLLIGENVQHVVLSFANTSANRLLTQVSLLWTVRLTDFRSCRLTLRHVSGASVLSLSHESSFFPSGDKNRTARCLFLLSAVHFRSGSRRVASCSVIASEVTAPLAGRSDSRHNAVLRDLFLEFKIKAKS